MAPQRGAKERADAAIVESVVGTEFGCEPVSTHRIILALRERGYGEHSRRMAGRWKRLMAKCVEFDESGDCLWTSRTMTCPHDNISLPSTSDPQTVCADCGQVLAE